MAVTLYYAAFSPPARCAYWVCKLVGVRVNVKSLNLAQREQMSEEFLKINPQHIIPTLIDDDLVIWESGAIAAYLANAYGKDDKLYPKDPKKRAIVDQRLHFANGTFFTKLRALCFPVFRLGQPKFDEEKKKDLEEAILLLNTFLEGQKYVAGDHYTIADISLVTLVSSFEAAGCKFTQYKNVLEWLVRCKKEIPGYHEANQVGADIFGAAVRANLDPLDQF